MSRLFWLTVVGVGCTTLGQDSKPVTPPAEIQQELYERSLRKFPKAIYFKPREGSFGGLEERMAPLIVQEVTGAPSDVHRIGAVAHSEDEPIINVSKPTVYVDRHRVVIDGRACDRLLYVWRYPQAPGRSEGQAANASVEGFGVAMTLAADGTPLLWEGRSTTSDEFLVFVSETLEERARQEFGPPLNGRMFAVESDQPTEYCIRFVRKIDDGPIPMGPYVYLSAPPNRRITTVLCRCMPSQVEEFVETRIYELRSLVEANSWGVVGLGKGPDFEPHLQLRSVVWGGSLPMTILPATPGTRTYASELNGAIRWPSTLP